MLCPGSQFSQFVTKAQASAKAAEGMRAGIQISTQGEKERERPREGGGWERGRERGEEGGREQERKRKRDRERWREGGRELQPLCIQKQWAFREQWLQTKSWSIYICHCESQTGGTGSLPCMHSSNWTRAGRKMRSPRMLPAYNGLLFACIVSS